MLDPANWTARLNELNLAALTDSETEEQFLRPADSSGTGFVLRSHDDEPWVPLSFGQFGDGTPYISLSGRVTPRVGLAPRVPVGRAPSMPCWARSNWHRNA